MVNRRMVTLISWTAQPSVSVPEDRVREVLVALHYLEKSGYGGAVNELYLLCMNQLKATRFGAKLVDEGLAESYDPSTKVVKIDRATQAIVLAAITYNGRQRFSVARQPKDIIQH